MTVKLSDHVPFVYLSTVHCRRGHPPGCFPCFFIGVPSKKWTHSKQISGSLYSRLLYSYDDASRSTFFFLAIAGTYWSYFTLVGAFFVFVCLQLQRKNNLSKGMAAFSAFLNYNWIRHSSLPCLLRSIPVEFSNSARSPQTSIVYGTCLCEDWANDNVFFSSKQSLDILSAFNPTSVFRNKQDKSGVGKMAHQWIYRPAFNNDKSLSFDPAESRKFRPNNTNQHCDCNAVFVCCCIPGAHTTNTLAGETWDD